MAGESRTRAATILRYGTGALAAILALIGGWALLAPYGFYRGFPVPGWHWVSALPPYNEHVLRDFGGLNLGMAVLLAVAAYTLDRLLLRTALVAYLVFAVPHLAFHLAHLEGFPTRDVVGQVLSLGVLVAGPVILLIVERAQGGSRHLVQE